MQNNRAVIYARYSAGSGQTDQSIEGQVRECKKYIKQQSLKLIRTYEDKHITGRTDKRPEFQRMISDAEAGRFDVLVVYTTDRFSRDKYDSAMYKRKLKQCGVRILYAAENIPDGPEGILLESLMEGWAQYYSEELSRKVRRGMHDTAAKCKSTGATTPVGYIVGADQRYEVDPDVAPCVLRAFEMYSEGSTFADVSRFLAANEVKTSKGNRFSCTSVKRMLTSRRYIGEYKYDDVIIEGGMPAIVPEELFYVVQKKIEKNHRGHAQSDNYLLSGKLFCGECGKNYKGVSGTGRHGEKHYYYKCTGKCGAKNLPARKFETFIADEVSAALRDPEMLDLVTGKIYTYYLEKEKADRPAYEDPAKKLAKVEKAIDALILNLEKRPGSDALLSRLDALEEQRDDLKGEIAIEKGIRRNGPAFSREAFAEGIQAFLAGFDFDDAEKTTERILDAFVRKVVKKEKKILIELNLTGVDPLEIEDLLGFDQRSDWWARTKSGRTFICRNAAVLVVELPAA